MAPVTAETRPPRKGPMFRHTMPEMRFEGPLCAEAYPETTKSRQYARGKNSQEIRFNRVLLFANAPEVLRVSRGCDRNVAHNALRNCHRLRQSWVCIATISSSFAKASAHSSARAEKAFDIYPVSPPLPELATLPNM